MMKKLLVCIFATMLTVGSIIPVSADSLKSTEQLEMTTITVEGKEVEVPKDSNYTTQVYSFEDAQNFDLTLLETQTKIVELDNGELGTLTLSPAENVNSRASYDVANGLSNWNIYWYGGYANLGYKITVSNPPTGATTITSYSNNWYTVIGATLNSYSFTRNSSRTSVEFKLHLSITPYFSFTNTLTARVSGNTLVTSFAG